jgi:predicted kinase
MSASKMREHATSGDFGSFRQGVPSHVPEKHAKELFRDVRKGMGIHESANHGMFKAIFISGGPGSGKDIVIREAIAEQNAIEITSTTAISILNDKHKLYEFSRDTRREAIRQRQPLIITGTTNEQYNIIAIREELEELGYETMMVFVNTSNESSRKRNEGHERMMAESVRQQRWEVTQLVAEKFNQEFKKYLEFDNSIDLNEANEIETSEKEEDISIIYEMTNWFFDTPVENEIAESWMIRHKKHNINKMFENFITKPTLEKGYKKYVSETKTNSKAILAEGPSCTCGDKTTSTGRSNQKGDSYKRYRLADNICPSCELVRRQGKPDDIKDGGITSNSSYTFRTYESSSPTITTKGPERETRFQQDNDKQKSKRQKTSNAESGKVIKTSGVTPEYDTRGSGTVYPMAGLGQVTYREQTEHKYDSTAEVTRKSFNKFRKESIDSPSTEMGVTGGYHGPSNKEPMDTLNKIPVNPPTKKKKK